MKIPFASPERSFESSLGKPRAGIQLRCKRTLIGLHVKPCPKVDKVKSSEDVEIDTHSLIAGPKTSKRCRPNGRRKDSYKVPGHPNSSSRFHELRQALEEPSGLRIPMSIAHLNLLKTNLCCASRLGLIRLNLDLAHGVVDATPFSETPVLLPHATNASTNKSTKTSGSLIQKYNTRKK
jgi:hypothetical protein